MNLRHMFTLVMQNIMKRSTGTQCGIFCLMRTLDTALTCPYDIAEGPQATPPAVGMGGIGLLGAFS